MNEHTVAEIDVSEIQLLDEVQSRVDLDKGAIKEFAEKIKDGVAFPPIVVFQRGEECVCADGFHRVHAARKAGVEKIAAEVREGDRRDAILHSVGANATHGVRRKNADKRRAVEMLLSDDEWAKYSSRQIGDIAAVSHTLVDTIRSERTGNGCQSKTKRKTADGRAMDVSNIGKSPRREHIEPSEDTPGDGDAGQGRPTEGVADAHDPEQSNAPTPPVEREGLNLADGDAHGSEGISGGVADDGADVDALQEERSPGDADTGPPDEIASDEQESHELLDLTMQESPSDRRSAVAPLAIHAEREASQGGVDLVVHPGTDDGEASSSVDREPLDIADSKDEDQPTPEPMQLLQTAFELIASKMGSQASDLRGRMAQGEVTVEAARKSLRATYDEAREVTNTELAKLRRISRDVDSHARTATDAADRPGGSSADDVPPAAQDPAVAEATA